MTTETIIWVRSTKRLPDSDMSVLAVLGDSIFMAWWDGEDWHDCATGGVTSVDFWAEVAGPDEIPVDDDPSDLDDALCGSCNGSGEGMTDGSTCYDCGGSGDGIDIGRASRMAAYHEEYA